MTPCDQCGLCCLNYSGTNWARTPDLLRWFDQGRKDILEYVTSTTPSGERTTAASLTREELARLPTISGWTDPRTGREILPCPFLHHAPDGKYYCTIHATKSQTCRNFEHEDWEMFVAYRDRFL